MAVSDSEWLAYWWPELLVWVITVCSLAALPVLAWRHRRIHRLITHRSHRGIPIYLDDKFVLELREAEDEEIEEGGSEQMENDGTAGVKRLSARTRRLVSREVRRRFRKSSEPAALLGGILDRLDKADEIVRVDLVREQVTGGQPSPPAATTSATTSPTRSSYRTPAVSSSCTENSGDATICHPPTAPP
ncbi:hypothetical protein Acor_02340 [Acrocarpospora corrugata]|uniref:Uncharacterized protein n=1 Tax=Acrocarpospora corrugata TaxID=35763 RepID=A0A5M3VSX8_9ACTN|nr:hypothetical protein [Acrocarpospora corrugata]GER98172.1 hypothetical protein Acor_02340 [Acrocarpospora corrugata]